MALAERVEKIRVRVLEAIRKKGPDGFSRPDLEMVALDYFRRLGHDNNRRLSKLYAFGKRRMQNLVGLSNRGLREDRGVRRATAGAVRDLSWHARMAPRHLAAATNYLVLVLRTRIPRNRPSL
jgi:hypothetical protein